MEQVYHVEHPTHVGPLEDVVPGLRGVVEVLEDGVVQPPGLVVLRGGVPLHRVEVPEPACVVTRFPAFLTRSMLAVHSAATYCVPATHCII